MCPPPRLSGPFPGLPGPFRVFRASGCFPGLPESTPAFREARNMRGLTPFSLELSCVEKRTARDNQGTCDRASFYLRNVSVTTGTDNVPQGACQTTRSSSRARLSRKISRFDFHLNVLECGVRHPLNRGKTYFANQAPLGKKKQIQRLTLNGEQSCVVGLFMRGGSWILVTRAINITQYTDPKLTTRPP